MATYTDSLGFSKGSTGFHNAGLNKVVLQEVVLNIDTIVAARLAASATALAADDVLEVLSIPAKTLVLGVGLAVDVDSSAATATVDIGNGDGTGGTDFDGWIDGANVAAAGGPFWSTLTLVEAAPNTLSPAFSAGKVYTSAGVVSIKFLTAVPVGAVLRVLVLTVDLS